MENSGGRVFHKFHAENQTYIREQKEFQRVSARAKASQVPEEVRYRQSSIAAPYGSDVSQELCVQGQQLSFESRDEQKFEDAPESTASAEMPTAPVAGVHENTPQKRRSSRPKKKTSSQPPETSPELEVPNMLPELLLQLQDADPRTELGDLVQDESRLVKFGQDLSRLVKISRD